MILIVYFILPVLGSIFIFCCEFYGMYSMGTDRKIKRSRRFITIAVYTFIALLLSLVQSTYLNLVLMLAMPFIGIWIYHSGKKYFIYYLILAVVVYLTDGLVVLAVQSAANLGLLNINSTELLFALTIVVVRLSEFMVIRLTVLLVQKNNGCSINGKQLGVSLILPVFSVINVFTLIICMQVYATIEMTLLFLLNVLLLIGLNIYFTVLFDTMGDNQRLENELNLFRQQTRMQCGYYEREERKYEESRRLIHDIRNHIGTMEQLYQSNAAKDAAEYAGGIHSMLNSLGQKYYTANKLLNIILNDKVRLMHQKGIREDIKIGEVNLSFMQDVDITTLFANLLDNAVESAEECSGSFVTLRVNAVREFISIIMENSCRLEPEMEITGFKSKKAGHQGLGLKNVCRAAKAYDGDVQCEWKDGVFYTKIMLVKVMPC